MLTYQELKKHPSVFKALFGISLSEFKALAKDAEPIWDQNEYKRLSSPNRQRKIGGGRKYTHDFESMLLMTLMWLRLYFNLTVLGLFFNLDKSNVSRINGRMLAVLATIGESTLGWELKAPGKYAGKNLAEVITQHPDLWAIVDATEQRVRRSSDKTTRKKHYSGKKKCHTRKTQIVVNENGLIRDVSHSTPGSVHDITHFRQSGVKEKIPETIIVAGDKGYQGLGKDMPEHSVITPFKNHRNYHVTMEEMALNQEFSSFRMGVEHAICKLKHFQILAQRYRNHLDDYDTAFRAVVGIVNRRTVSHLAMA